MDLPPLAEWLRWIAGMPAVFSRSAGVRVPAVVADLFESLFRDRPPGEFVALFSPSTVAPVDLNRLRWVLAACHVLWHPALRPLELRRSGVERLLVQDLASLAAVAAADSVRTDRERGEELARRVLGAAGLRLPGESAAEAEDRLAQVDSVERHRILAEASEKERRARKQRDEEVRRRAAAEAASKAMRE